VIKFGARGSHERKGLSGRWDFANFSRGTPMKLARLLCTLLLLLVFACLCKTFMGWSEDRGVYDDICYLRQAHLFERFGWNGFDTDIASDDDNYFAQKLKNIDFVPRGKHKNPPCHNFIPLTGKTVMQYPMGPGLLLAMFPSGFQVAPLYIACTAVLLILALASVYLATTPAALLLATLFGGISIYLMNNPVKSSYSLAPTMVVCALTALLISALFNAKQPSQRFWMVAAIGLLLGLGVNLRIANLVLAAGFGPWLLIMFLRHPGLNRFLEGAIFGAAFVIGVLPTLWANHVNTGSALISPYDVPRPQFSIDQTIEQLGLYLGGTQGVLLVVAALAAVSLLIFARGEARQVTAIAAMTLLFNMAYFFAYPIFTPYYLVPAAMLSLWLMLWGYLLHDFRAMEANAAYAPACDSANSTLMDRQIQI
jgi:hypothetical protein